MIMDMEILISVIMEDAYQEAQEVLQKAEKEAVAIQKKALKEQARHLQQNKHNQDRSDIYLAKAKMISQEELKAKMEIIHQKEAILEDILNTTRQDFFSLVNHANYPSILRRLIIKGLAHLEGNDFTCQVNERDRHLLSPQILDDLSRQTGKKISLCNHSLKTEGGVIIQRCDGRVLYDNTLAAFFSRQREDLRALAAERLFGDLTG